MKNSFTPYEVKAGRICRENIIHILNQLLLHGWLSLVHCRLLVQLMSFRIRNIAEAFKINLDRQDWYELYAVLRGEL
jgi:predicted oxidoreductase